MVLAVRTIDAQREYRQAKDCLRKLYRKDTGGHEENSYIATWYERHRYENNWKLAVNAQDKNAPMKGRQDYSEAVNAIKDLCQKGEEESFHPILPSHQTRQRPVQERQRSSWSTPSSSSSAWTGSQTWWDNR